MRRLTFPKKPSGLLAECSCSSRPLVSNSSASRCVVQRQHRKYGIPAPRRPHGSEQVQALGISRVARAFATSSSKSENKYRPRNGLVEEYIPENDPEMELVDLDIPVQIKAPERLRSAPRPDDVDDATYTPALTAEGLEEVGDVAHWWEDDKHWSASLQYVGFGRSHKITDPAVLEVLTRRAVVEALAVRQLDGEQALGAAWQEGGREALLRCLEANIEVDEKGTAALKGDVAAIVESLKTPLLTEEVDARSPDPEAEQQQFQEESVPPAQEANEFCKSWDKSWKSISLEEPRFKFAVTKRIQQLTGHVIADHKLLNVRNVATYLAVLVKPAPPKKVAEVIEKKGELQKLPNVKVYTRRVTPIDKEKMVGRWKVLVRELEKRELPVVGTGAYSKTPERKWAQGKS